MALNALYFSPNGQVMRHPSGRSYAPTSLGLCTIPVADAMTWSSGGQEAVPGPTGPPASTIFQGQRLMSSVVGAILLAVLLLIACATAATAQFMPLGLRIFFNSTPLTVCGNPFLASSGNGFNATGNNGYIISMTGC